MTETDVNLLCVEILAKKLILHDKGNASLKYGIVGK
jgi:hypothetical protein